MKELNKNNPFKTPEGYFDSVSDFISDRLSEEKGLLPKKDGFTLPEDYLDSVNEKIQRKLSPKKSKVIQFKANTFYYLAAASAAVLFILAFSWYQSTPQEPTWNGIAQTDIESYFKDQGFGLSSYEIAEEISLEGMGVNDFLETELNDENIVDYLNEHADNFEELNVEDYE